MAIMTQMRSSMKIFLWIFVFVFLGTIIFEWGMDYLGLNRHSDTLGVVDGRKISYQEFSELVKQQTEQYKQQSKQEPDETIYRQIRDQVWNTFVTQTLLDRETKKAGIEVSDQEVIDWVRGDNPPQFLTQQFTDSTGHFRRDAYEQALNDPRNKDIWLQVETSLRQQRLAEKMQSVVFSTIRVTEGELAENFSNQYVRANVTYAFFDPNRFVQDNEVTVSDDDIKTVMDSTGVDEDTAFSFIEKSGGDLAEAIMMINESKEKKK